MALKSLRELVNIASGKGSKTLVVAVAQDEDVLGAVKMAMDARIIIPVLVGDHDAIRASADQAGLDLSAIEIIHEHDKSLACARAVKLVREGRAQLLMKGMVSTGMLVKAILDKETGLLSGSLLSHIALFESPYYHKIICVTDAALNISPDLNDKAGIIANAVKAFHQLGIQRPKVAVLAAVETVNPKMEATVHAAMLTMMQKRNQITGCLVDGPLALDNAISFDAAKHKGIVSEVAGDADILLAPDLNTGNVLYKMFSFLGGAEGAAIVTGATVPVVLTSRADPENSKFLSIALGAAMME